MGILPLAIDMPMRFTETESRDAGVFKHTRCVLKEIEVDPEEKDRIEACEDAEIALCQQPKHLCVEIETKTGEKKYIASSQDTSSGTEIKSSRRKCDGKASS